MELKKYKLGEIGEIRMCKRILKSETQQDRGIPFYKIGTFGKIADTFIKEGLYKIYKEQYPFPHKGDVLISAAGTIGRCVVYDGQDAYFQDSNIVWIENDETKVLNAFLYYILENIKWNPSKGSTILRLYNDDIRNKVIYAPPLEVQRQIVAILSALDRKIELNKRINDNLEAMAKQLYDYWFVQFDFPDGEGKPYKASGGKMVWNEKLKREIPEGWKAVNVSDIANVRRGRVITSKETSQGEIKVVAAAVTYSYLNGESNRPKNTITVSGSGANAGFINFWREPIFASDCTTVNCSTDIDTILCLYGLYLFQERLYSLAVGAAQPHVYPAHVASIPILAIPQSLKQRVSDFFCKSNDVIATNLAEIEKLTKQRDELLPLLMNGQASVNAD